MATTAQQQLRQCPVWTGIKSDVFQQFAVCTKICSLHPCGMQEILEVRDEKYTIKVQKKQRQHDKGNTVAHLAILSFFFLSLSTISLSYSLTRFHPISPALIGRFRTSLVVCQRERPPARWQICAPPCGRRRASARGPLSHQHVAPHVVTFNSP